MALDAHGRDGLGVQDVDLHLALRVEGLVLVGLRVVGCELGDRRLEHLVVLGLSSAGRADDHAAVADLELVIEMLDLLEEAGHNGQAYLLQRLLNGALERGELGLGALGTREQILDDVVEEEDVVV